MILDRLDLGWLTPHKTVCNQTESNGHKDIPERECTLSCPREEEMLSQQHKKYIVLIE